MTIPSGHKIWVLPQSVYAGTRLPHETGIASVLNTCDIDANLEITIFYSYKEPAGPYKIKVPAKKTVMLKYDGLIAAEVIPPEGYSSVIKSDIPVIVSNDEPEPVKTGVSVHKKEYSEK